MPHRTTATTTERSLYLMVRGFVALTGLVLVLATLSSHLLTPGLLYDEAPGPPALRDRIPTIALSVAIGVLLCAPHRWSARPYLFWPRLGIYGVLAAISLFRAAEALAGEKSWHVFPASASIACMGLMLPLCLLWSRRAGRVT